jgi:hypothetical protein
MSTSNTTHAEGHGNHLGDLSRDLPDWLRARTGWPESAVVGACRLAAAVTGAAALKVEADVELDHEAVLLHVDSCREAELTADVPGAAVRVIAHEGDVVLRVA